MENNPSSIRHAGYVGAYFTLWLVASLLLRICYGFAASEALPAFVLLALLLPALCLLATRSVKPLPYVVRRPGVESAVGVAYLAVIAVVLVSGFGHVERIGTEPLHSILLLTIKLATFVIIPAALVMKLGGYRAEELLPVSLAWRTVRPALWISLAVLLVQAFLGRGLRDIRAVHLPVLLIVIAVPLSFAWLLIEVGLVEEFFFRSLLQERLQVLLRSSWGGLALAALLFGLVHAPGLYLRTPATQELLPAHPPLLFAVGYSIVVTSLAGLFLGVLWMRTKNFAVVAIVHAAGDLLPNLLPWIKAFHLAR